MAQYNLLGVGNNAKTVKGDNEIYLTAIMYMAPYDIATSLGHGGLICPYAKIAKCYEGCLYSAGRGQMNSVQASRIRKTKLYLNDRDTFSTQLYDDVVKFRKYCFKRDLIPVVRPNGTSDINFKWLVKLFHDVQFYDYTKVINRIDKDMPANYDLTLSYSEANMDYANSVLKKAIKNNVNMAVVFRDKNNIPKTFKGLPVINGDKDDLRFLDAKGANVVALYAKGAAKKDTTGFVIDGTSKFMQWVNNK
jgi:hypothetical protein